MNTEFAILLVVDDPLNARLIAAELEKSKAPIRIDVVHDGEEALDYLLRQTRRPQLSLVDLDPPKVGGLEVIRAIKQRPDTSTIPVVALTSSSEPRDVAESYRAGVNSYVRKQTGFEEFRKSIRALVLYWTRYNHTAR